MPGDFYGQPTNPSYQFPPGGYAGSVTLSASPPAERVLALDDITNRVMQNNAALSELLAKTRQHADALFGSQPSGTQGGGADTPKMPSRIVGLSDVTSTNSLLVAAIAEQFERFRAL